MVTPPHENINMDAVQRSGSSAPYIRHNRGYTISCSTVILLGAFFLCTLTTVSFVVYNFATCDQLIPADDENIVCTTVHLKHKPNETGVSQQAMPHHEQDVRLPRSIKPLTYNISLEPYLYEGNFSFDGEVHIVVRVLEDCYNITMHAVDLNISKNDVTVLPLQTKSDKHQTESASSTMSLVREAKANSVVVPVSLLPPPPPALRIRKQYLLEAKQFFVIEFYDKLTKNTDYVMHIKFNGIIQDSMQGFYRSSYQVGNETRWLASTQFQATDARKAFPCFDEPALKAKFIMNIARPRHMTTLSNMPIVSTRNHDTLVDYEWDHFAESVPMSTYLVAYCISDFKHMSVGSFSVWTSADIIQSAAYALSIGPRALKFFEDFFLIKFPLPKIDMIAVPDFSSGAMENWGLITFREAAMLFEHGISASTCRQRVASVVVHELAHQWFGNLVTPSWWSDLWLNEGFATYMEFVGLNALEPDWRMNDQFVVSKLQSVFQMDSLSSSHKISVNVGNPDEVAELFDNISYDKGATVIRMMDHFLTTAVFRKGLNKYLKEKSYASAEQNDLWHFLTMEAKAEGLLDRNVTVKDIMDTWTLQVGFPVVSISKHPNTNVIRLEQHQFSYNPLNTDNQSENGSLWWIPITYTTAEQMEFENTRPITWIPRSRVYEIESQNLSLADWFIFNIQQSGYYRVHYDSQNWQAITKFLMDPVKCKQIAPSNRAQLIDDAMNLAKAGYISYGLALNLTRYLVHENDMSPWKAAMNAFTFIDTMIVSQGDYDMFKKYLLRLVDKMYNERGFADSVQENDMLEHIKRGDILHMACHLGHQQCIGECVRHFQNWVQVPNPDANNPISPNLRSLVYCTAIEYGTEAEWSFLYERFKKSTVPTEKEILLTALACSKEPWILSRLLRYAITAGYDIRKQDTYRVFLAVSSNVVGQKIAFDFVRSNWEVMKTYLGSSVLNFNSVLKYVAKRINTKYALAELQNFVRNDLNDSSRSIQQIIEHVQENVNWMNKYYTTIVEWLRNENENENGDVAKDTS